MQRSLSQGDAALRDLLDDLGRLGNDRGSGHGDRLRRPSELLDAPRYLAGVALRLLKVLLEALLVRLAGGHRDVSLERRLELALLSICLVQILNELRVPSVQVGHDILLLL
jgi:hypothetical protein